MITLHSKNDAAWRKQAVDAVRNKGCCVVEGVLTESFLHATREAMYRAQKIIEDEVGPDRLHRAGEIGVLRLMLKFDPHFFRFLEIPEVLAIVDDTVSDTAILHLQNGFILPSLGAGAGTPRVCAAGRNIPAKDRLAVNLQFTRSYIKQQIDYVRALGDDCVRAQSPRTQQLLGYYARVVTSLDEYYRPETERLYRKGQG